MILFASESVAVEEKPDKAREETDEKHRPYIADQACIPGGTQALDAIEVVKEVHLFGFGYGDKADGNKQGYDRDAVRPGKATKNEIWLFASVV
ncbi:hypothetical protein SAMN05660420_01592 [Desulfuromusa kysingii]|uniref:Uncharacterized protein n=1 Tax=Desulfuromusa kysingii TaxID=37625 RepID=A0A1H3ZM73_9BACT|nr:hypothetical protein SAMN05660420_01592 [Desulfuromusa kysingii]